MMFVYLVFRFFISPHFGECDLLHRKFFALCLEAEAILKLLDWQTGRTGTQRFTAKVQTVIK